MKSIGSYFRVQLIIAVGAFVFIMALFIFLYSSAESYQRLMIDTSTIFSSLNKVFSQGIIEDQTIDGIYKYVPQNRLGELKKAQDIMALQTETRAVIAKIQDVRTKQLLKLLQYFHVGIIAITPFFFLMLLLFIITDRYINKILIASKNMLLHFHQVLLIGDTNLEGHKSIQSFPYYREIQDMGNFFQLNLDLMNLIQELLTMDLSFSIESFIDQFGSVFCSDKYQHILPCDRFSLAIYHNYQNQLVAFHATVRGDYPVFLKKGFKQDLSETSLKKIIDQRQPFRIINRLTEKDTLSSRLLLQEGIRSNLTVPIMVNQRLFGFLFFAHRQQDIYTDEMGKFASLVSNIIRSRVFYSYALQKTLSVFGDGIVNIVEFKDDETADHTRRVSLYSALIADVLREEGQITPQKADEIREYAPLHDLGKIGIPDSILLKPGPLTAEEWIVMKQHPLIGGKLIKNANQQLVNQLGFGLLHTAYNIIVDHHEWWNGSGYPQGKKGMDISIEGQIVAIADVFDALSTKRPYKEAFPIDKSLEMLIEQAGTHFNPELIKIFTTQREQIYAIYQEHYVLG
ncbi:HD-GYP domain-containing protein [Gracilinema caldarium]|uniref:HD-GYP domain-containing protein n=1 Tax=Gracilinema caldarium TaxID=215591 RepID=UPI0026EB99EC|nr:HD domain-containing phosphohydrolase [Gracilinema caldarium]